MSTTAASTDVRRLSNEESNKLTKECICTALIYLLAEKDFDKISITDIVNKSGVSRATFYRNYGTKESVVKEITQDITNKLQYAFEDPLFKSDTRTWLINGFRDIRLKSTAYISLLKSGIASMSPVDVTQIRPNGRELTDIEKYRMIAFLSAVSAIIVTWIDGNMKESNEELADIVLQILNPNI